MRGILHGITVCLLFLASNAWFLASNAWAKDSVNKLVFPYDGHPRTVYYYAPDTPGDLPIVVLLHGSGRDGTEMLNAWKSLAVSEHFILAAPNSLDPAVWDSQNDPPMFLHAVVEQVKAVHATDMRRVYLFGNSGGAVYALAMALVDSEYYAATAVHAGALPAQSDHLFTYPKRNMPVAIWVGDRDAAFPVERVKATKAAFDSHGFKLQLTIIPNHNHGYDQVFESVDKQAWQFFKEVQLPSPNQ